MIGVYKITSPSGRIYIGSSVNIGKRWSAYRNLQCANQTKLYRSLIKYGALSHVFEVLCECSIEELREKESYYGDLFKTLSQNGLNCNLPKNGSVVECASIETIQKMRAAKVGKPLSKEHREKISAGNIGKRNGCKMTPEQVERNRQSQLGKKLSENHKQKLRVASTGYRHTEEAIEKCRRVNKGRKHTQEHKEKNRIAQTGRVKTESEIMKIRIANTGKKRPVEAIEKTAASKRVKLINVNTGEVFPSFKIAAENIGVSRSHLSSMLTGFRKNYTPLRYFT